MGPVEKSLWYIENRLDKELSLAQIAEASDISCFHLSRAFAAATGYSVMQYVRARRLTEAAKTLAAGTPDILTAALQAGYSSHQAFTRVFSNRFGITPKQLRLRQDLNGIELMERIMMDRTAFVDLAPPRIEQGRSLLIAGLQDHYNDETSLEIPKLWQQFSTFAGRLSQGVKPWAYGVVSKAADDGSFDYLAGIEVTSRDGLPDEASLIDLAAQTYAVFTYRGHFSGIAAAMTTIWNRWLPESGYLPVEAPCFSRFDPQASRDAEKGKGQIDIWIPVCQP